MELPAKLPVKHTVRNEAAQPAQTHTPAHRVAQARANRFNCGADGLGYRPRLVAVSSLLLDGRVDPLFLLRINTQRGTDQLAIGLDPGLGEGQFVDQQCPNSELPDLMVQAFRVALQGMLARRVDASIRNR